MVSLWCAWWFLPVAPARNTSRSLPKLKTATYSGQWKPLQRLREPPSTPRSVISFRIQAPATHFGLAFLPLGPGDRLEDEDGDRVENVRIRALPIEFRRDGERRISWDAQVVEPGTYSFVIVLEQARFVLVGYERLVHGSLMSPSPTSRNDPNYILTTQTPRFEVKPGEAIYLGTFKTDVRMHLSFLRTDEVRKSSRTDSGDLSAIATAAKIDPSRVRTVNLFDGKGAALRKYQGPVTSANE